MLEKYELKPLSDAVGEKWANVNFAKVNEHYVRLRIVTDRAASFHVHENSDELFCCIEGTAYLDTESDATITLRPHELAVVPRNTSHRLRVEGKAVLIVIDAINR